MSFAPLNVPGVAGEITTTHSFWTGYRFFVGGQRVRPRGFPRNKLTLPGLAGPVEAKVKGGLLRAHPTLVVGGTEYPTGPAAPRGLVVLALLPLLSLIVLQGILGFLLAFGSYALGMGIIRSSRSDGTKAALLALVLAGVIVIDVAVVVAVFSASS